MLTARVRANGYKDATRPEPDVALPATPVHSEHVAAAVQLERVDHALDPLRVLARGDQERVGGVDHDDVAHADEADDAARLAHHDAARGVGEHARVLAEDREVVLAAVGVELGEAREVSD